MAAAIGGVLAAPPADPEELTLPARLKGQMTIVNSEVDSRTEAGRTAVGEMLGLKKPPGVGITGMEPRVQFPTGSAQVTIEIRRWTLEEERDALHAAIDSGGVAAVIKATKKLTTLGDVHVGGERLPIRAASTWMTDSAQHIRLVFSSRLVTTNADPMAQTTRALDILDLTLPHGEKYGTGSLVTATQVESKEPGLIEAVTFAIDSATQPIDKLERLPAESR
ncbi:MAG TPA: hypothetical protein VGS03_18620 [Candidatus Polarisedimenticolia bacterium]|nr:hypothetical protein [Candidatus Polarisedimenticolia bacterium]